MGESGRLVYVAPYYPPFGAGGAELTGSLHARLMVESGQEVTVVTPNYGAAPKEVVNGVEVVRFDCTQLGLGQQVPARRFAEPPFQRALTREIIAATGGRAVRCVHAQHQFVVRGAARAARRLGVPLVAHLRDTSQICSLGAVCLLERGVETPPAAGCGPLTHAVCHQTRFAPTYLAGMGGAARALRLAPAGLGWCEWRARGRAFAGAARIAFASDSLRGLYEALPPFRRLARNRTVYAPAILPGADSADGARLPAAVRTLKAEGRPIVLHAGKASRGKGIDVLVAAWREVVRAHGEARLVLAGNIDAAAWEVDLNTTVILGFVDRSAVEALYAAADVVVLPATWPEPLGWATLDSARHGKPIVATRAGGISEAVIDGETGLLVERLDPKALAHAISSLIADKRHRATLGERARAKVIERFGSAAVTRQLRSLYAGL